MKRSILSVAAVLVLAAGLVLSGCQLLIGPSTKPITNENDGNTTGTTVPNNGINNGGPTSGTVSFSVNLTGAKALVTKTASTKSLGRGFQSRAITDSPLAKILDDGSVENVIVTDGNSQMPNIKFLAVSPTGDVFVYFEYPMNVPTADGKSTTQAQFIKLNSNNTYEVVEANVGINEWTWNQAGNEQKPVVFNDDGSIYYACYSNTGLALKRYMNGVATTLTSSEANANITAFFTDGTNLYYAANNNAAQNKAFYLRMVPSDGSVYKNVFYVADGSQTWVRTVKRLQDKIYLQGWRIPATDEAGKTQFMNGLVQISKDAANNFSYKLIVGYMDQTGATGNFTNYSLRGALFNKDDGTQDTALLNLVVRPFFTGGVVPANLDLFKSIKVDRDDKTFIDDFGSSDEAMFWYLLLKDATGFIGKTAFIDTFSTSNGTNRWWQIFQTSLSERIANSIFTVAQNGYYTIPSSSSLFSTDGSVDSSKVLDTVKASTNLSKYFAAITVKASPVIPTMIAYSSGTDTSAQQISAAASAKTWLDGVFTYSPANKTATSFYSYSYLDTSKYVYRNYLNRVSSMGYSSSSFSFDDAVVDAIFYDIAKATNLTGAFARKTNAGASFDPLTSYLTNEEVNYRIEWEFEKASGSTAVFDKTGVLGKFRVIGVKSDSRNFIGNFYTNVLKTSESLQLYNSKNEYLSSNVYAYSGYPNYNYELKTVAKLKSTEALLTDFVRSYTNALTLTMKEIGDTGSNRSLFSERGNAGFSLTQDEIYRLVAYKFSTLDPSVSGGLQYSKSNIASDAWYRVTDNNASYGEFNFINNFFKSITTPPGYPIDSFSSTYPSFTNDYLYLWKAANSSTLADISTTSSFLAAVATDIGVSSLTPKTVGGRTFNVALPISSTEVSSKIAWKAEENDPTKEYLNLGTLGPYRVVTAYAGDDSFIANFFTTTLKTYDLTSSGSVDLQSIFNYLSYDTVWSGNTSTNKAIYSSSAWGQYYTWKSSFIESDGSGSLKLDAIRTTLSSYIDSPLLKTGLKKAGYSLAAYSVDSKGNAVDPAVAGTTVDNVKSTTKLLGDIISNTIPTLPSALAQGVWSYAGSGMNGASTTLDFNSMDSFSVDTKGQIFGLFKSGSAYTLAKLMDAKGNVLTDKILKKDIAASTLKVSGDNLYLAGSSTGFWTISKLGLAADVPLTEELLPAADGIELFKWDVAEGAVQRLFFTGSNALLQPKIGYINLTDKKIHYQESSGIGSSSSIAVYSQN